MKYVKDIQRNLFERQNPPIHSESSQSYAFTLVELLVVISVIAMLAAMLMPELAKAKERARNAQCQSNRHQYDLAERMYEADWNGVPSDELESLRTSKYLNTKTLMECPSKGVYLWIGERGRDLSPNMGCSVHDYPTDSGGNSGDSGSTTPSNGNNGNNGNNNNNGNGNGHGNGGGNGNNGGGNGNGSGNGNSGGGSSGNSGGGSSSSLGAIDPFSTVIFILLMATMALPTFHDPRKSRN